MIGFREFISMIIYLSRYGGIKQQVKAFLQNYTEDVTAHRLSTYGDRLCANDNAIYSTCLEILTLSLLRKLEAR